MENNIPTVTLKSGQLMPVIGFGLAGGDIPEDLTETLLHAIESGYRHFDTAAAYGTEHALGHALSLALQRGLIASRDEVFVTSKLWCSDADAELVLPALKRSLENLGLEYLDLYLIHWPLKVKTETIAYPVNKEDLAPIDIPSVWKAMEHCCELGLTKSIGVSNFSSKKLSNLLDHATIPPLVNQVEVNIGWVQKKLREFCKEKGILITAYSPLGGFGTPWGARRLMQIPVLEKIATAKGKTTALVALRWLYKQGVIIIVKSYNKERMKENLQILDWELTDEELKMIETIPQQKSVAGKEFVSEIGPYKSVEELWDEEI